MVAIRGDVAFKLPEEGIHYEMPIFVDVACRYAVFAVPGKYAISLLMKYTTSIRGNPCAG